MKLPPGVDQLDSIRVEGSRLLLRPVTLDDVGSAYVGWLADPEVNQYLETRFSTHTEERISEFVTAMQEDPGSTLFAIVETASGRHIGNIKIGFMSAYHLTGIISLFIGDKDSWGKGYATDAIGLVVRYAREIGLRKVTAGCYHVNAGSQRAFERNGFEIEGRLRDQYLLPDGSAVDEILLGKLL